MRKWKKTNKGVETKVKALYVYCYEGNNGFFPKPLHLCVVNTYIGVCWQHVQLDFWRFFIVHFLLDGKKILDWCCHGRLNHNHKTFCLTGRCFHENGARCISIFITVGTWYCFNEAQLHAHARSILLNRVEKWCRSSGSEEELENSFLRQWVTQPDAQTHTQNSTC